MALLGLKARVQEGLIEATRSVLLKLLEHAVTSRVDSSRWY